VIGRMARGPANGYASGSDDCAFPEGSVRFDARVSEEPFRVASVCPYRRVGPLPDRSEALDVVRMRVGHRDVIDPSGVEIEFVDRCRRIDQDRSVSEEVRVRLSRRGRLDVDLESTNHAFLFDPDVEKRRCNTHAFEVARTVPTTRSIACPKTNLVGHVGFGGKRREGDADTERLV